MREMFDGGLVNARDPSLLAPGELQRADNLVYRPASPSPEQFPGHTEVADAGAAINGLEHCTFDNGLSLLVFESGGAYKTTPANIPGVISTLVAHGTGTGVDSVHYDGRHYLFNGVGPNQVLLDTGGVRRHGLTAVSTAPGTAPLAGGTWPLTDDELPAYYEYWTTEVYQRTGVNNAVLEEIESTFIGIPSTVLVSDGNTKVRITRPPLVNTQATHWKVYRSPAKKQGETMFPIGFLVETVKVGSDTFEDGGGANPGLTLPTTAESITSFFIKSPSSPNPIQLGSVGWVAGTEPNVLTDNGVQATSQDIKQSVVPQISTLKVGGFGFTGIIAPITRIVVEVEGRKYGDAFLMVSASPDGGNVFYGRRAAAFTTSPSTQTFDLALDRTWSGDEFVNGTFYVLLAAHANSNAAGNKIDVDFIRINVFHGGSTGAQTIQFPITTVKVGDTEYNNGSRGEPPAASFGDIFEDSLVTNDPDNKGTLRYSLEVLVDAFPPEYFLPLTTSEHDELTAIKTLGHVLLVGLNTYMARVDFLPRAEDAEFARGRAWDIVQGSHGCVGKKALTSFFIPEKGLFMAHVSRHGVMMTNGYQTNTLTDDLDFLTLVDPNYLRSCEFVNHPAEYRLLLFYTPPGVSSNTKALAFYYHPTHMKNGKLKVTGPLDVTHSGAHVARLASGEERLFTASNGKIYYEGVGPETPFVLQTRDIYPGGETGSADVTKVMLHQQGGGQYRVTPVVMSMNTDPRTDVPIVVQAPSRGFVRVPMRVGCEGISFKIERIAGSGGRVDYFSLDGANFRGEAYPA